MNNPLLVTMSGPGAEMDVGSLSNFEAGIAFLALLDQVMPGVKMGDLPRLAAEAERMAGFDFWRGTKNVFGDIGSGVKNLVSGTGDVLKDTFSTVGDWTGDAIRLAADEKVIDAASRYGSAYATQGGSEGVRSLFGGGDAGDMAEKVLGFISNLGASFKQNAAAPNQAGMFNAQTLPWILGGGVVLALLFGRGGRR